MGHPVAVTVHDVKASVPEVYSAYPKGLEASCRGKRTYIFVMHIVQFMFLTKAIKFLYTIEEIFKKGHKFISYDLQNI